MRKMTGKFSLQAFLWHDTLRLYDDGASALLQSIDTQPGFYLLGGVGGGRFYPKLSIFPPQKFLNKNYSKCTKALIMHAHTTLSIVYLSTVSIDTCCWYTGVQ